MTVRSADLIVVAYDIDDIGALHLGDGLLRHEQSVFGYCGANPHSSKLAGPEDCLWIWELGHQTQRPRLQIHRPSIQ